MMSGFAAALVFPQWQGAGRRIGYAAGTACLSDLLPPGLTRHHVVCEDSDVPLQMEAGVKGLSVLARQAELAAAIRQSLPQPVLTIGGDCAADLVGAARANHQAEGDVALVWIDGHADLNNPSSSPSGHFHGMVVGSLMGDGPADLTRHVPRPYWPEQIFYVSARDCDPAENETIDQLSLFRLADPRAVDVLADEIARRGINRVYLHLDLDVLDPAVFPYVGVPAAHGINLDELCHLLQTLRRRFQVAGAAITELNIAHADEAATATPALRQILADGFGLALS